MQLTRGVPIFSNICRAEIILSWLGVNEMISTRACSQVKHLSIPTERWPPYPCTLAAVWMREWYCTTMKPSKNLRMLISPESMARMGKGQVPSIEGETPHQAGISLSRPWFSYTSRVFSFEEAGRRFSSPSCQYVDLLLVYTWGTPQHRQLPLKLAECFRGSRRDRLCIRDGGS